MTSKTGHYLCIISFICVFSLCISIACAECEDLTGVELIEKSTDGLISHLMYGGMLELMNIFSSVGVCLIAK